MSRALRDTLVRGAVSLATVAAAFLIIPRTPLDGPVGGVIAMLTVLACSWYGGAIPAVLLPSVVLIISRLGGPEPKPLAPTSRELLTFTMLTILTTAVGMAGQYRRHLQKMLHRHESRMREQARALAAARILSCDLTDRVETWSEGVEQLYGWTALEAQGRIIHDLLSTQFPIPIDQIRAELQANGQWQGEVRQRHKNGKELMVFTHWILTHGDEGLPTGIVQVQSDVTDLRAAEAAARENDRRKDIFLATLAHELRNPLAPLSSGLELLSLTHGETPSDQEVLGIMHRQLGQMVRLIDDLLDVSRINSGKINLRRGPVLLSEVIGDAVEGVKPLIEASQHELTVRVAEEPLLLDADRARLTQVVVNLLNNAAKFTAPHGQIALTAERESSEAVVRIRDTGIGIRAELLPRVFDLYSQEDDLHRRTHGGLGIGLCIVRSLVEMHGGSVAVRSEGAGQGSEFTVRLPLVAAAQPDTSPLCVSPLADSPAQRRILIVDDNQDAASTLARLLQTVGCETRAVFDGPSALDVAASFRPHVFVLDLGMPGMSGLELAQRLRAAPAFRDSVLIAVTGWGKDEDRRQTNAAGFDHHLVKPIDLGELRKLVMNPTVEEPLGAVNGQAGQG